jgi:RNA polymerase primary sigma factor
VLTRRRPPAALRGALEAAAARVDAAVRAARPPASLEAPLDEDGDASLGDLVADEAQGVDDAADADALRGEIGRLLAGLDAREGRVVHLRYGLGDGRPRTLEETGRELGVTRERVRQIEARALRKLRHPSRAGRLRDYLDP